MERSHWVIALLLTIGCQPAMEEARPTSTETEIETANHDDPIAEQPVLGPPIDINELKRQPWLETTSGVLGKKGASGLCPKDPETFFGLYFLIDRRRPGGPPGRLTISKPHAPTMWRDDDQDENFVQLELSSGRIKIWDRIAVGDHEDSLMAFLGNNFRHRKVSYIVAQIGDYHVEFNMQNDTIRELTVRKTCDQQ